MADNLTDLIELGLEGFNHITNKYHDTTYDYLDRRLPRRKSQKDRKQDTALAQLPADDVAYYPDSRNYPYDYRRDSKMDRDGPRGGSPTDEYNAHRRYQYDNDQPQHYQPYQTGYPAATGAPPAGHYGTNNDYYNDRSYELERGRHYDDRENGNRSLSRYRSKSRHRSKSRGSRRDKSRDRSYGSRHDEESDDDRKHSRHMTERSIGASIAGAIAGGLVGKKVGKHDKMAVLAGAVVGALGAGAAEKQFEKHREKKKEREQEAYYGEQYGNGFEDRGHSHSRSRSRGRH